MPLHKASICKRFDFPAAHRNTRHQGLCQNVHGHTWMLDVYARGRLITDDQSPEYGMVMDFTRIKDVYKEYIEPQVEHQYLNDTIPILEEFTTEIIAAWILREMYKGDSRIYKVRLWEGLTSYCEVRLSDLGIREPEYL